MSPERANILVGAEGVPRASGDEPLEPLSAAKRPMCSPRERG
mgnify:CR=1 FL=1